jgi:hypothetical protein
MIQALVEFKSQVDGVDPRLWNFLMALLVGAMVYAFKRARPELWQRLPSRYKVLPATAVAMLVSGAAGQDVANMAFEALFGATSGLMAAGGHEFWDRLLSPSGGAPEPPGGTPT